MKDPNQFGDYYKTIMVEELVEIIDNEENYQAAAIEAARNELLRRNISEPEIAKLRANLLTKKLHNEKQNAILKKAETVALDIANTMNPVRSSRISINRQINIISIVFGVVLIIHVLRLYTIYFGKYSAYSKFSFEEFLFLEPLVILLLGVFFFWQRVTIGWQLLMIYLVFSTSVEIWTVYEFFKFRTTAFPGLRNVMPNSMLVSTILYLLFLCGAIYVLCKQPMWDIFKINKKRMINAVVLGVLSAAIIMIYAGI